MPDFIFIAPIVFGEADPRKLGVPIDLKNDLYRSTELCCDNSRMSIDRPKAAKSKTRKTVYTKVL